MGCPEVFQYPVLSIFPSEEIFQAFYRLNFNFAKIHNNFFKRNSVPFNFFRPKCKTTDEKGYDNVSSFMILLFNTEIIP